MSEPVMLRASSFGSCIRAQVAVALGSSEQSAPAWLEKAYARGNEHEDACLNAMADAGWIVNMHYPGLPMDEGQAYVTLNGETWQITGHLDGIAFTPDGPERVLEIKAPSAYDRFDRAYHTRDFSDPYMDRIAWQTSVYMVATGLECVMACWTEEAGVKTFGIELPVYSANQIRARANEIVEWVERGEIPGVCSQDDGASCPVSWLHDAPETLTDAALDTFAEEYERARFDEAAAKKRKERARDEILAHGGGTTDAWKVSVYDQAGPARWDEDAMMEKYGDGVLQFKVAGKKSPRVKVTKQGEK